MLRQRIFLLLLFFVFTTSLYSQSGRPKIGLVLSGGGAKGLAHVGVLKAMEEAGLTPDYITGTSMGSVVGGLYAMGYSAADLEQIVNRIDWDDILTNKIPLSEIVIEEKPYYNRYISEIPLTGPFKPSFPPGLIEGQKLEELLLDLTRPVHDVENFSQLSIPFACVATDISTGRGVVLNRGSLAQCLRASMAIPGVFTPVEIDGRLLVDGGLVRNFPVQEVIDMGADIVIGVFVSDDLKKKEDLDSFVAILFQSSWVMSAYDTREQRELVDYYVEPVNTGYSTGDFKRSKEIIHQGELIGQEFLPRFKRLADSVYALGPRKQHIKPVLADSYFINRVEITGSKKLPADVTRRKLAIDEHTVVASKDIEKRVTLLFGTQHFNSVGYHLARADSGYNLVINTRESAPGKLKGAFHYDTENKAGININYTLRNALFPNSRAIAEVDLAEYPRLDLNYLKYIGKHQDVAAMMRGDFNSIPIRVNDGQASGDYLAREYSFNGSVFTTMETNRSGGVDFSQRHISMKPEVGREFDHIRNNSFSSQLWFQVNSLERPFYPRRGEQLWTSVTGFFDTSVALKFSTDSITLEDKWSVDNMLRADIGYIRLIPLRDNIVLVGEGRLAVSNFDDRSNISLIGNTFFGGFKPRGRDSYAFYGANSYDYSALSYFLMKADVQVELKKRLYLTTGINFITIKYPMFWLEEDYARQGNLRDEKSWRLGYGASLGYLSVIGPISASVAIDQERAQFVGNFSMGFFF